MMNQKAFLRALIPSLWAGLCCAAFVFVTPAPLASAQEAAQSPTIEAAPARIQNKATQGPVTNLPLPRFVSLKADEANLRRGPSLNHRIDWIFQRKGYPLEVIAEYGHWRRVRDLDGASGWVHYSLISGVRMGLANAELVDIFARPENGARVEAQAQKDVLLRLHACDVSWCRVSADGHKGWALKSDIWGVRSDEVWE